MKPGNKLQISSDIPIWGAQRLRPYSRLRSTRALTLVEVSVSVALLGLVFVTAAGTLIGLNKHATSTRLMTNVREIVQRNIETAVAVPFTSGSVPPILAITSASGEEWDDGTAVLVPGTPPKKAIPIYKSRDWNDSTNTGSLSMTGEKKPDGTFTPNILLRIVTAEPVAASASGADIRRVTFRLNYKLYGRNLSYELTTIRANDQ